MKSNNNGFCIQLSTSYAIHDTYRLSIYHAFLQQFMFEKIGSRRNPRTFQQWFQVILTTVNVVGKIKSFQIESLIKKDQLLLDLS